jgi:hypothetical protein
VVGDSEQMPPSSFGESTLLEEDMEADPINEEVVEDEESIVPRLCRHGCHAIVCAGTIAVGTSR